MKIFRLPLNFSLFFITFVCFALGFLSLGASQVRAERSLQQVFDDYFGPGVINTADETGKTTFPAGQYKITLIAKEAGATFAPNGWYPLSNPSQLNQIFPGGTVPLTTVEVDIPTDYGLWIQTIFGLWKSQPLLNFDGVDHFRVFNIPGGGFAVGIEDLAGGGDWDFQDHVLAFVIKEKVYYFNQTDLPWGPQEYDSGNTLDLWCGSTIAQCGCAVTSAAMLLKYYGVDKNPSGQPTTPETLNNWLKANKGYLRGNIDWLAVSAFSKKAHDLFGTPIVDFRGTIKGANFTLLNNELNSGRPAILEEPSHFVVATGQTDNTYSINDPRWREKTTLESYGNTFLGLRKYALTHTDLSGILIATEAPTEFLVIDSQGRKTGKDPFTGDILDQIPNTSYYFQPPLIDDTSENLPQPPQNSGAFFFEALDPITDQYRIIVSGNENYTITFRGYDQDAEVSEQILEGTSSTTYVLNYSPDPGTQINVAPIVLDIKPGSESNPISLKSNGLITIAILTTPSFDASIIDVDTIEFSQGKAKEAHDKGHLEDVDNDGDTDLVLHFKTQDVGIQNEDSEICLTGETINGIPFSGCDSIKIVPK